TIQLQGIERVVGGNGVDVVTLAQAVNGMVVELGSGADTLKLAAGTNSVTVSNTELVLGNSGSDWIIAKGNTATRLEGGAGDDALIGGGGADVLYGGMGQDRLTGGSGPDRFLFKSTLDSMLAAPDRITDFTPGQDLLAFEGLGQKNFMWLGANGFTKLGFTQARFEDATSTLQLDVNGDAVADMAVTLDGLKAAMLSQKDFSFV
ncbi:M10 family metallopeptidase C-terminal domain-containing protein, partial [Sabulicella rubraurantiaca]|uniref:M10 family metallopeptidase C-terminal domain-containing protein n=1 Tax=Sabulicella rubraurantiaca TaxID=2811429 RepID=UPI001A96F97B